VKEGKGGPLLCNLTTSQGLDLAAGGAATVSVRGFSADGKWLLARSGEQALVAFPVGGTTPVEVVAGGKGVTVGGVHCVDMQEDFSGVLVEVAGLVPGGARYGRYGMEGYGEIWRVPGGAGPLPPRELTSSHLPILCTASLITKARAPSSAPASTR